jgi:hypothetical protein
MPRRREPDIVEPPPRRYKIYDVRDNMMIKLALLLSSKRSEGINPTMAQTYFRTLNWSTSYDGVKSALEDMVRHNWAKSKPNPYKSNATVYILTEEGAKVVDTTNKLLHENNPLTSLKAFKNLPGGEFSLLPD